METITGLPIMTIAASAGIFHIKYEISVVVDIYNATETNIYIGNSNDFDNGAYLIIPAGGSYNNLRIGNAAGTDLYIKAESEGSISVVCGRY